MVETIAVERRKVQRSCRLSPQVQRFIIFWPLLASWAYLVTALGGSPLFGGSADSVYRVASLAIAMTGIFATVFWRATSLRSIMASLALGRSFSTIIYGLFSDPQLGAAPLMRLTGAAALGILFFGLALVEMPYLKAMQHELK